MYTENVTIVTNKRGFDVVIKLYAEPADLTVEDAELILEYCKLDDEYLNEVEVLEEALVLGYVRNYPNITVIG